MLQTALGGNSKTLIVVTLSPARQHYKKSLEALRFGLRAQSVVNLNIINRDFTNEQLREIIIKLIERIRYLEGVLRDHAVITPPIEESLHNELMYLVKPTVDTYRQVMYVFI